MCQDDADSQYFDLASDPYEGQNLYSDPAHREDIAEMKAALAGWALFDAPYPVHSDDAAPIIAAANAQRHNAGHREEIYAYFEGKMKEKLAR